MALKIAFVGFRHGHIYDLVQRVSGSREVQIVAACEEDEATRKEIAAKGTIEITHTDRIKMMDTVACDIVAVGDCYGKRGRILIEALERGKHVISDKPICTALDELEKIAELSRTKGLKVGCQLTMRDMPQFVGLHDIVRSGTIGVIHSVIFTGHHPLMPQTRPSWYFEPGMHGGTINDIGIHAMDFIPWATGMKFVKVNAARSWNAMAKSYPHFMDAGQVMLTMENNCGVLGDVSYFSPDSHNYNLPFYWRITFYGEKGIVESSAVSREILLAVNGNQQLEHLPLPPANEGGYFRSFLEDIIGVSKPGQLNTHSVLEASRIALIAQKAGDYGYREVSL